MSLENLKVKKSNIRLNPITLILINLFLPLVNTIFPSSKGIIFTMVIALLLLLIFGSFFKFLKALLFVAVFFSLYKISVLYIKIEIVSILFKMTLLFLPCFVFAYLLISEYNTSEILSSLEKLRLPKIFVIALTVTLRYIPTFRREFRIIKDAMSIRGVDISLKNPIRTFEYLIVPQLFRCLNLSSELTSSALIKGINAPFKRTSYFERKFSFPDFLVFFTLIVGQILIVGKFI